VLSNIKHPESIRKRLCDGELAKTSEAKKRWDEQIRRLKNINPFWIFHLGVDTIVVPGGMLWKFLRFKNSRLFCLWQKGKESWSYDSSKTYS